MLTEATNEDFAVDWYFNPVSIMKEHKGEYKSEDTRLTGNVTFEPIKGWQTNLDAVYRPF
jgi:hypothetical protein